MKKFPTLLILPIALFLVSAVTPAKAQAQASTQTWNGVCTNDGMANGVATIQGIQCVVANILSVAITVIGVAGFVMFVFGAFKILISGSSKGMEEGRNIISLAVVGIVVALASVVIINLIASFTGVNAIKTFVIPNSSKTF
jgi:hypothetical protein